MMIVICNKVTPHDFGGAAVGPVQDRAVHGGDAALAVLSGVLLVI